MEERCDNPPLIYFMMHAHHQGLNSSSKPLILVRSVDEEWQRMIRHLLGKLRPRREGEERKIKKDALGRLKGAVYLLPKHVEFVKKLNTDLLSYHKISKPAPRYRILQACIRFLVWLEDQGKTIDDFSIDVAKEYIAYLKDERGVRDLRNVITMLRHLARVLKVPGVVEELKYQARKPGVKKEDLLSREEVEAIIENISNPEYKVMAAVLAETGMRLKEIRSLRLKDVEATEWGFRLHIREEYTKTEWGARTVAVVERASLLAKWLELHPCRDPEAYLFPSPKSPYKPLGRNVLLVHLKKAAKKAGIDKKRVYNHLFRHVRATQLYTLLGRIKPKEYLRLFGWSLKEGYRMLSIYEHLAEDRAEEAYVNTILGVKQKKKEEEGLELKLVKCGLCGFPNPPSSNYCGKCGTPLKEALRHRYEAEAELQLLKEKLAKLEKLEKLLENPAIQQLMKISSIR